ncbi:MAG: hypothetical protein AAFN77_02290 [Planctomycetota bacterium]
MAASNDQPDQLVIVVHGVGDPPPGETLSLFARSIADHDEPLLETDQTLWLDEKSPDADYKKTFPAHRRSLERNGKTIELCEAFWGDLSRVRRGWLGVLEGMFQIIFGLRYVAYVAADQPGRASHWLKTLGLMSSRVLHGPVLAVTFFLGLLILAVCGTHVVWPDSYRLRIWTTIVLLGCSGLAILAAQIGTKLTRSRVVERFWFWVNVTTAFVTGVMLIRMFCLEHYYPQIAHSCDVHPGLLWYCRVLLILLGMLWFIEIQVILAMAVCWALALTHKKTYAPALHVGLLLPALAIGIWAQAIPMMWVACKESFAALAHLEDFASVFDDAIPFLGVQLAMLAVLMITVSIVLYRYGRWRTQNPEEAFRRGNKAPRLIVNGALQSVLGICTLIGVALVSSLWLMNTFGSNADAETASSNLLVTVLGKANGYAIAAVVPLGGLMFFVLPHLRPGFDIILDVVNHFYFRPTNVEDVLDDDDEFDIAETTFENGMLFFSRREELHGRLRRILIHYRDELTSPPELIIMAHSQGTMVAIETLNDKDLLWLNNAFRKITLVTMGSPFHHLYQHYFGHCYPELCQPFWASLRRRVDHWVNIFRVDDFVGLDIDFPDSDREPTIDSTWTDGTIHETFQRAPDTGTQAMIQRVVYENHAVGARGHVNYWTDREVLEILLTRVFERKQRMRKAG